MKKTMIGILTLALILVNAPLPVFAGTVSGTINFDGAAPERDWIDMGADPTCESLHDDDVLTEEVVVNDGKLQNVFVYVKEGLEGQTFDAPATPVVLDQHGCQYHPHVFGVQVGQPVEIVNSDGTLHNVHSLPTESKEFNIGMPMQGMKIKKAFDSPEVLVKFKCDVHPWMSAWAGVVTHPFFSVSAEDGTFTIENLPAGTYTIEAVHEKFGAQTASVTVDDAGAATADFTYSA